MAISKVLEFAKDGLKSLSGLEMESGFPREEKPAREWFNYLFNLIFSMLNEIINEVNRLREDVDAINARLDAAESIPDVTDPTEPVTPPLPDSGLLKATSSHKGDVETGNTIITQYVADDVPDGTVIKFRQSIQYSKTAPEAGSNNRQHREGTALVNNGKAVYTFPVSLPVEEPYFQNIGGWSYVMTDMTTLRTASVMVIRKLD